MKVESSSGDVTASFSHNTNFTDIGWKYLYTLNLLNMTPHIGQKSEVRVYRDDNSEEVARTKVDAIAASDFSVSIPQIEISHNYTVDFYADLNGNGNYDAPPTDHAWRMTFNSSTGNFVQNFSHNTNFTDIEWPGATAIDDNTIPVSYSLNQNYPNPFNPSTNITFSIPSSGDVLIKVFDILGREVTTIINENLAAGNHTVPFDAANLESGVYIYQIQSKNFVDAKKMMLVK